MQLVITALSESGMGRKMWLGPGQSLVVGRTERASFAVPDDPEMSEVHFTVICQPTRVLLRDRGSLGGTYVNDVRVEEAPLKHGDCIVAGRTRFAAEIRGIVGNTPSPNCAAPANGNDRPRARQPVHIVGDWHFFYRAENWEPVPSMGLRRRGSPGAFPTSVVVTQMPMPAEVGLEDHVRSVCEVLRRASPDIVLHEPRPTRVSGACESWELLAEHPLNGESKLLQWLIYARAGSTLGQVTLNTNSTDFSEVNDEFRAIRANLVLVTSREGVVGP